MAESTVASWPLNEQTDPTNPTANTTNKTGSRQMSSEPSVNTPSQNYLGWNGIGNKKQTDSTYSTIKSGQPRTPRRLLKSAPGTTLITTSSSAKYARTESLSRAGLQAAKSSPTTTRYSPTVSPSPTTACTHSQTFQSSLRRSLRAAKCTRLQSRGLDDYCRMVHPRDKYRASNPPGVPQGLICQHNLETHGLIISCRW